MNRTRILPALALLSLALVPPQANAADQGPIVAVFDLEVKGTKLDKGTIDRLTDYLGSLMARKGFQVVPRSQLKERLTEAKKGSYKDCYDESCQIEVGKELAAQKSLASQVLKIGSQCKVTVNLYDLRKATSDGAGAGSGKCDDDGVVSGLEQAVEDLLSREVEARKQAGELARKMAAEQEARKMAPEQEARKVAAEQEARKMTLAREVKQPGSDLHWLRCPLGQTWNGSACQGERIGMNWDQAMRACPADHRLPTRQELVNLLGGCAEKVRAGGDGSCASCAKSGTCRSMFGEADGWYWSSSDAADSSNAWSADFFNGRVGYYPKSYGLGVRCVRSGP